MIYMFLSNNPSSGDVNSSNLSCSKLYTTFEKNNEDPNLLVSDQDPHFYCPHTEFITLLSLLEIGSYQASR